MVSLVSHEPGRIIAEGYRGSLVSQVDREAHLTYLLSYRVQPAGPGTVKTLDVTAKAL